MRQVRRALRTCRIWKDESVGIITRWQPAQIVTERLHERQHYASSGLASGERNLALFKIHCSPRKARQVAEPLAEIQTEKNEAAPFGIIPARFQDAFDFWQCESAPCRFVAQFEHRHAHRWIHSKQTLLDCLAKTDAQDLHAEIGGRA